jgi:hypothetical protein
MSCVIWFVTVSRFPDSRMALSPIAHHLTINLAGIAERLRFCFDDFVPPLARAIAYTSTAVMRLALLQDALPNPVVRELLERFGLYAGEFGSTSGAAAYEFSGSMAISKIIAPIFILLFRRRDSAA